MGGPELGVPAHGVGVLLSQALLRLSQSFPIAPGSSHPDLPPSRHRPQASVTRVSLLLSLPFV